MCREQVFLVTGINATGDMVGTYGRYDNGFEGHGFLLKNGTFSYFDYPGGERTTTGGINDLGMIVGSVEFVAGGSNHGFLFDGQTYTRFDAPGQLETSPIGINNAGVVVGTAGDFGALSRAFVMRDGQFRKIQLPTHAILQQACGINNSNQIAGRAIDGIYYYAFLYKDGQAKRLEFPGSMANSTIASAINDSSIVVGSYFVAGDGYHGFAYYGGRYVSFAVPNAIETYAAGINASGQIVGSYVTSDYVEHGFVTGPITTADF